MSTYTKPYLTYQQQLALIESRGATCTDKSRALRMLESLGYYNVTGYLYPYRMANPAGKGRLDTFQPGTDLADIETLIDFDRALRACLFDGVQLVEVSIRARIAYMLGRRNPFAHVDIAFLDPKAATRRYTRGHKTDTAFNWWLDKYQGLQDRADKEPFVAHNLAKYGTPLPIWVACEFFDFGAVTDLYELMYYSDRQIIAAGAGLTAERTLRTWLRSLNHIRNACAHGKRLWNRVLTVKPAIQIKDLPPDLIHLARLTNDKPYPAIAITAYLTNHLCPDARWSEKAGTMLKAFPVIPLRSITEMGAPLNWVYEPIWK